MAPDLTFMAAPEANSPTGVGTPACAQARIVVLDDEPLNGQELVTFLLTLGYQRAVSVVPGAQTLEALRDARPDLVLLELGLHQPTAFDVLGWMRADPQLHHVPVVAVMAQDDRTSRLRALALGAADCLIKPIDPADLELRLHNTLATKQRHDRLAYTDGMTGLPNRESSRQQLGWALKFARRYGNAGAVLQVGLDRFKQINDALGPAFGDAVLRAVGLRLVHCVRETDVVIHDNTAEVEAQVARGDGDEFTLVLPAMARADHAGVVARRIVEAMAAPFVLMGHEVFVTCQVGIAVFPSDSLDTDIVLRQAKLAMHQGTAAERAAGSSFRFYSPELNGRSSSRLTLEVELRHAIERDELVLHYQPKVDLASGRICGAEALVRWQHPQRGLLGPGAFIEVAEETGLIVPLGEWVLREALRQVARWRQAGLPPFAVAVNVASLQLHQPHLERTVQEALAAAGLDGASLCLELTESAIMDTGANITGTLHAIKELGVRVALDDFGTGYSSLSYLRRFPLDELKIDRSFIVECQTGNNSATVITQAIIAMAHGLHLSVVAEGVETPQQLDFLRANACDQYQGFFFSRPVPAAAFDALFAPAARLARPPTAAAPAAGLPTPVQAPEYRQFADTAISALLPL